MTAAERSFVRILCERAAARLEAARIALATGTEQARAEYLAAFISYQLNAGRLAHTDNHHGVTA